jgi:excisionase family DNA binding protein
MPTEAQEQPPPLIDIPTAAARLGLSITAVRRKIREGTIPAYRMGGANTVIRIDPAELEAWVRGPEQRDAHGGVFRHASTSPDGDAA